MPFMELSLFILRLIMLKVKQVSFAVEQAIKAQREV